MKYIKETSGSGTIAGHNDRSGNLQSTIDVLEHAYPEMTSEFKRYKKNNMNCFVKNNMITAQVIFQLVHN